MTFKITSNKNETVIDIAGVFGSSNDEQFSLLTNLNFSGGRLPASDDSHSEQILEEQDQLARRGINDLHHGQN